MPTQIIEHALLKHKITLIRNKDLDTKSFREIVNEISMLMAYDITRNLPLTQVEVETPLVKTTGEVLKEDILIVPVLRAGLGMVEGMHNLIPTAKIAHVGMYRDPETLEPKVYYEKYPKESGSMKAFILDPLLATGGSVLAAIDALKRQGVNDISVVSIIGVNEGLDKIHAKYPDINIYLASLDEKLNEKAYIEPGLGDAGDRLFGTK